MDNSLPILITTGGPVDELGICLAVYGVDLEPAQVTAILGCGPSSSHRRGEQRGPRSPPLKKGAWLLEVRGKAPTSADELLADLLSRIPRDENVWIALRERFDVQLRFAVHMTGWNRGFGVSAAMITAIAKLHAELVLDIYAYDEDE